MTKVPSRSPIYPQISIQTTSGGWSLVVAVATHWKSIQTTQEVLYPIPHTPIHCTHCLILQPELWRVKSSICSKTILDIPVLFSVPCPLSTVRANMYQTSVSQHFLRFFQIKYGTSYSFNFEAREIHFYKYLMVWFLLYTCHIASGRHQYLFIYW